MKNISLCILILGLLASPVFAGFNEYKTTYDIYSGSVLVELIIGLEKPENFIEIEIPMDAEAVEVRGHDFEIINADNKNKLAIRNPANIINLKYITSAFLEKSNKDQFFILNIKDEKEITLKLPEKAVLKYRLDSLEQPIFPRTDKVSTDGKRIIIMWDESDLTETDSILVIYNQEDKINLSLWLFLALAFVFVLILSRFLLNRFYKKGKERNEITRNLFDEEKKIISALLNEKNKEMWQKQLEIKTGITKVRLSRKIRNLEQKGLIEKVPYGNTNKIRIKD